MSTPIAMNAKRPGMPTALTEEESSSPDVSWLIHSNSYHGRRASISPPSNIESDPIPSISSQAEASPQPPVDSTELRLPSDDKSGGTSSAGDVNGAGAAAKAPQATPAAGAATPSPAPPATTSPAPAAISGNAKQPLKRPHLVGRSSSNQSFDENSKPGPNNKAVSNVKNQQGRRSSWISNLSSKFSSSNQPTTPRSASLDQAPSSNTNSPPTASSKPDFQNPFGPGGGTTNKNAKTGDKPVMVTHTPVRRPSQTVLVHAGQERKESHSGFLSSALRRLSSSGPGGLGKGSGNTPGIVPRKVMNIDQNRERSKIGDFDENNLRRVAFVVDVEIAGIAGYADEEEEQDDIKDKIAIARRQSLTMLEQQVHIKHKQQAKDAKLKDKGEGAALKMPKAAVEEKEEQGITNADLANALEASQEVAKDTEGTKEETQPIPTTRKKEKKKRSEAERKERRERKRRLAAENGEIPLELSGCNDLDDDDSIGSTPPGASTPVNSKPTDQPTTDPLRIYKRCCQLRETTALKRVTDQISMPSSTLAEAPGTVAVVDLSGEQISFTDVVTLGDWLGVVPVRKLILDDCGLTDESVRVILAGLLGCKTAEQLKQNKRLPKRGSGQKGREQMGVIEKLSMKKNDSLTSLGWKHIGLFLHMSRSLKAIDLSGIPFPKSDTDLSRSSTLSAGTNSTVVSTVPSKGSNLAATIAKGLSQRFGDKLEEMILSACSLTAPDIGKFIDGALKCKLKRFGLADNHLNEDGLEHVVRYLKSGICEGLDLGENNMHGHLQLLADAVDEKSPFIALSLSQCGLDSSDLSVILPQFTKLPNFRFIDLSHNQKLFSSDPNAVSVLRKFLPRLNSLKRIHLADVDMSSEHAIAIAEILPECSVLAHLSLIENPGLTALMNSRDGASQEEACALFASLMTAVRVSRTIIAIDIEIPSAASSEVVRALASQVMAYCLRNMEQDALHEYGVAPTNTIPAKDAPEVLLHLVGHMDGYTENHDKDEPAPDEDYMIASTGIVKALGICLGTADSNSRTASRNISPTGSGTATPRQGPLRPAVQKKPRDMSKQLLDSARKIRLRLRPALVREDSAGNDINYKRLHFLDSTLERIIQRFEDEYPETRLPGPPSASTETTSDEAPSGVTSLGSSLADASVLSASTDSNGLSTVLSSQDAFDEEADRDHDQRYSLNRTASGTSLAARALANEEGRMHRLGQSVRREILRPTGTLDYAHGTSTDDEPEAEHIHALRTRLERLRGDEIMEKVRKDGADSVLAELNVDAHQLLLLQKEDPEEFQKFKESQLAAQINAGYLENDGSTRA